MRHADAARNGSRATRRTHPFTPATQDWRPGLPGQASSHVGFPRLHTGATGHRTTGAAIGRHRY
jgi:hypothetical protein